MVIIFIVKVMNFGSDFDSDFGNIALSLVEYLGEFLICSLIEGLWEVDNGCNR